MQEFPEIVKDIIKNLLQLNKSQRTETIKLREHPFFSGVNFNFVFSTEIPCELTSVSASTSGSGSAPASASIIDQNTNYKIIGKLDIIQDYFNNNVNESQSNPEVVKEGLLMKRNGWGFYYDRHVVLTNKQKLLFYNSKNVLIVFANI
jgi:hypothetical protein